MNVFLHNYSCLDTPLVGRWCSKWNDKAQHETEHRQKLIRYSKMDRCEFRDQDDHFKALRMNQTSKWKPWSAHEWTRVWMRWLRAICHSKQSFETFLLSIFDHRKEGSDWPYAPTRLIIQRRGIQKGCRLNLVVQESASCMHIMMILSSPSSCFAARLAPGCNTQDSEVKFSWPESTGNGMINVAHHILGMASSRQTI